MPPRFGPLASELPSELTKSFPGTPLINWLSGSGDRYPIPGRLARIFSNVEEIVAADPTDEHNTKR
jgi:hypothetical protein